MENIISMGGTLSPPKTLKKNLKKLLRTHEKTIPDNQEGLLSLNEEILVINSYTSHTPFLYLSEGVFRLR